jgi:photosystem II stability/assembly factor-like uncharacterized protein
VTRAALLAAALAALAAGCGGGSGGGGDGGAKPSEARSIVDPQGEPPLVNSLEVEPGTGTLLVTTNRGFFRIDPEGGKDPAPVRGTVTARGRSAPVGRFLEILPVGPKALLGSGHPDRGGALPEFIGVMRSEDGGRTWSVIARLGEADLHRMVVKHDRLFAFDAVLGVVLVSEDGGRTFREKVTPPETMVELEVDPADPRRMLLASEQTMFRSDDGGDSWRPLARAPGARLAWPAAEALYRAEGTGTISLSPDGGDTWRPAGQVEGEPARLKAVDARHLYLVLETGAIHESRDGARTWKPVYEP